MTPIRLLILFSLVLLACPAQAGRVEVPLRVPLEALRQALEAQFASAPGRPSAIYREGRCRYLTLDTPSLEAVGGHLQFAGPGSAALGLDVLGACQNAAAWKGSMQFTLAPMVDNAGRVRLRVIDSRLTDAGGTTPALGFIWEMSKRYVHPRLHQFSYDLGALRASLLTQLRGVAPPQHAAQLEAALASLQVLQPRVEAAGIVVPIALELPDAWLTTLPPTSSPALTEAELEALDKALQPWDAFLVYSIRQVARDGENGALRRRLFTLLLASRHQLSAVLAGEAVTVGDPLRALFVDAWNELRTILTEAHRDGLISAPWLNYAMFIDAGDALLALDTAAPGLGMRLTADGLRQLVRTLRPGETADPLAYDWAVDPELRQLFDVDDIPASLAPPRRSWLEFLIRSAHADTNLRPLDHWVPSRDELALYQARVGELLSRAAAAELQRGKLAEPYGDIFLDLVPATALIESCWRQYVHRGGKVSYLRSSASSVGIMQINERVWRGFYDIQKLRWDTAYNVRAGTHILMRYVKDYAIPFAQRNGDMRYVPRAAYAVYNAGPRAVGRFAKDKRHPREARVDDRLWSLYQGIAAGGRADLRSCDVTSTTAARRVWQ
jgi:hypothetical protein